MRIAYVLAGKYDPEAEHRTEAGLRPRFEYGVFAQRNRCVITSGEDLWRSRSLRTLAWKRLGDDRMALGSLLGEWPNAFDAIVASGEDVGIPLALNRWLHGLDTPIYSLFHGHFLGTRKFRLLAPLLRQHRGLHFMTLSAALRDQLLAEGFSPERCHAVGYAVDDAFFTPRPWGGARVVASAGASSRDYRTLVEASRGLDATFRIAAASLWPSHGPGVDAATLPPNVEARDYAMHTGLRDLYAESLFVAVPLQQVRYGSGYSVIAEAMAMGRAVIATRTHAPSDFVVDGRTGFLVEPGDVEGLRARLRLLLDDPDLALRLGAEARRRMETEFSLDRFCGRMEDVIRATAVTGRTARRPSAPLPAPVGRWVPHARRAKVPAGGAAVSQGPSPSAALGLPDGRGSPLGG